MTTSRLGRCKSQVPLLFACVILALLAPYANAADLGIPAFTVTNNAQGQQVYSLSIQVLILMTALSFLPAALIMMTSFTRIVIVLAILRQAMGLPQTPPTQVLVGLALFLTFFIMSPVFEEAYRDGAQPYLNDKMPAQEALDKAVTPFKKFMLNQTRTPDIELFANIARLDNIDAEHVPLTILLPAFVTSELKTAFQMGFLLFLPFLIIDLVVASILMAMGMMMLSPMIISLPFKIMLFVLIDGWSLIMGTLAASFF
ncbi:MAG: flagellar type III secretion system pore protein FliP [Gammaproteobacteria bacterium]|nr:flagellar type III secretion system pore protein FliP [Gammaproteobacteria bacterium]